MATQFDPQTGLPITRRAVPGRGLLDGLYDAPKLPPAAGAPAPIPAGGPLAPGDPLASPAPAPAALPKPKIDLHQLIENDPLYKQTAADVAASRISSQAQLSAARRRALTMYGEIPDFSPNAGLVGEVAPDVDNTVRQLAQQNTAAGLSTTGRLRQAYDENVKALQNSLAARGLLSSGETGYQVGKQNTQYQQTRYDALQQLLDLLANYQGSYLSNDAALRAQLRAAAEGAAGRVSLDTTVDPGDSGATPPPPPAPTSVDEYFRRLAGGGFAEPTTSLPGARLPGLVYAT